MANKQTDKIKTFKDLSNLFTTVAKKSEENNKKKDSPANRRQRGKAETTPNKKRQARAASTPKKEVPVVTMTEEDTAKLATMARKGTYPIVADLVMASDIDGALEALDECLRSEPDSLQLLTARNLLRNCLKQEISKSARSQLLVNVKHVLMNTESGERQLSDITSFNEHENAEQIEAANRNREFSVVCDSIAHCLDNRDLREAALSLAEILEQKLTRECRDIFRNMFKKLKVFLEEEAEYIDPLPEERYTDMVGYLRGKLSDGMMEALTWDEREEKNISESRIEVDLPLDVSRITVIKDVPMLIDIEGVLSPRELEELSLKRLANTTYLGRIRVIGVPTSVASRENNYEEEFGKAKNYIWRKERILLQNMPLRRPDSDATWFPIIPVEGVINNVAFPDRVRSSINDQISIEERRRMQMTNTIQIRARREAFEAVEGELVRFIDDSTSRIKELRLLIKEYGEQLKDKFGVTTPDPIKIKVFYRDLIEDEIRGDVNVPARMRTRVRINRERDRYLNMAREKVDCQAESRVLNRQLKEANERLEAKRRAVLNPNMEEARRQAEALVAL